MKKNYEIKNDSSLLDKMLKDMKNQSPLYKPGPYWSNKSKNAVNEIKRCGLEDFRGSSSLIGLSFADNLYIDYRDTLNYGFKGRFLKSLTNHYPFKNIFKGQISWTENYANRTIELFQELINLKPEVRELIKKYNIPYSLIGGCKTFVEIDGIKYSSHYLNILEQHDKIATHISFKKIKSVFEIGGGFGIYIHLLIENYPNIRKVIYLDIPPNLYVGSQYLKAFYNDAVVDYKKSRKLNQIEFSDDNNLEIFCVAPWQIEKFNISIDLLINTHSFVEMPEEIVKNYVDHFMKFQNASKAAIALISYDNFDLRTTLDPNTLPSFFKQREFKSFKSESLFNKNRMNIYYISS